MNILQTAVNAALLSPPSQAKEVLDLGWRLAVVPDGAVGGSATRLAEAWCLLGSWTQGSSPD